MSSERPHIIIFNPDQWRGDVMGHLGNPAAQTPHLDRIIGEDAVSFANAFCQATVCTPSRCSFMTGWYPHVRGHRTMHHMLHSAAGEPNLLKVLRDHGYFVWWGGKNDLVPGQLGYEAHCDVQFRPRRADLQRWGYELQEGSHGGDLAWRGEPDGDNFFSFYKGRLDKGAADIYFDRDWAMVYAALDQIAQHDPAHPLCLFLPIGYPHPPYCVEDPWFSQIDRAALPARTVIDDWQHKPALLRGMRDGQGLQDWDEPRWQALRATYYGMCARVDAQYGRIIDALRTAGLYDDSAVFLFSDHGDFTGDYGLVEKTQNTFEDCLTHVPLIIKPPKRLGATPGVRDQLVELVDFPATVYELAGIEPGYWHFGNSLCDVLRNPATPHRDAVFAEGGRLPGEGHASERESHNAGDPLGLYAPRIGLQVLETAPLAHGKAAMCRTTRFKYIRRAYEADEFYDLAEDPGETHNRIDDPALAPEIARLRERLLTWYMETCDVVPMVTDERNFRRPPRPAAQPSDRG